MLVYRSNLVFCLQSTQPVFYKRASGIISAPQSAQKAFFKSDVAARALSADFSAKYFFYLRETLVELNCIRIGAFEFPLQRDLRYGLLRSDASTTRLESPLGGFLVRISHGALCETGSCERDN